jgi:hypothetical protein
MRRNLNRAKYAKKNSDSYTSDGFQTRPSSFDKDSRTTGWSGGVAIGNDLYFAGGAVECGGGGRTNELLVFNLP